MTKRYFDVTVSFTVTTENETPSKHEVVQELMSRIMPDDTIDCCVEVEEIDE